MSSGSTPGPAPTSRAPRNEAGRPRPGRHLPGGLLTPSSPDWRPTASRAALERRAGLLARVRRFFAARGVLEVETPLLGATSVPDPHIDSLVCRDSRGRSLYLQTSPEYAMKRLLAAGSGPIYQVCHAFRDGEAGARHNPEFTILEWYRPGFDHHDLMGEVEELLTATLGTPPGERTSYRELFVERLGVDPLLAPPAALARRARDLGVELPAATGPLDRDLLLQLLFSAALEPDLGRGRPDFVHGFPASQAALARLAPEERPGAPRVAERFEVFVEGVELANGYHELTDADEQRRRFQADLERRRELGKPLPPLDERLLAALAAGLPACAGVALGLDRLLLLASDASSLSEVIAFPIGRA